MSEADQNNDLRGPLLLIVDENRSFRELTAESLVGEGFAVVQAANGNEALAALDAYNPALLVTDIVMHDMDGLELISKVRRCYSDLAIIAVSGSGRIDAKTYLRVARQLGANLTLEKPLGAGELIKAVCHVLSPFEPPSDEENEDPVTS